LDQYAQTNEAGVVQVLSATHEDIFGDQFVKPTLKEAIENYNLLANVKILLSLAIVHLLLQIVKDLIKFV